MPGLVINAIIVDDEPGARKGLRRLLSAHQDVHVIGEADSVAAAQELLSQCVPDVVFLDVEMPRATGFDLLSALSEKTKVVFVTAHSQHASRAFEVEALDYVLKPLRAERLAQTLERVRRQLRPQGESELADAPRYSIKDYISLRRGKKSLVVPLEKVIALQAEGDFTRFLILNEPSVLMGYTLSRYSDQMPQPPFGRVSRSLVVNLHQIQSVHASSRDETELRLNGAEQPIILRRIAAARLKALIDSPLKS